VAWRFFRSSTDAHVQRAAPLLRDLTLASRAIYEALDREFPGDFGLERNGMMALCSTRHAFDEERGVADHARSLGIPANVLETDAAIALDPLLREDIAGAVHYPMDCHLDPDRLMRWLNARVVAEGARVLRSTEVTDFSTVRNTLRAATTRDGEIEGDVFALCSGVWSPGLARSLRLSIPIEAGKGYSVTVPKPAGFGKRCAILSEARVAVTPMGDRLRVGGTMQLAGIDASIDTRRVRAVTEALGRYYRNIDADALSAAKPWAGLRPCTPDGVPYIGCTRRYTNLVIAAGHAMMGVSLGAVSGSIVGQLIAGQAPSFDMALLSPDRFH
jgi:D-amino-acid dehydrogenase